MNVEGLRSLLKARGKLERLGAVNSSVFRFLHTFTFKLIAVTVIYCLPLATSKKSSATPFDTIFFLLFSLLCDCVRLSLLLFGDCTSIPKIELFFFLFCSAWFLFFFFLLNLGHCTVKNIFFVNYRDELLLSQKSTIFVPQHVV